MNILKGKGTITPIQKNLLYDIGQIREASYFYLTGGTALAEFYLGHRRSYDLDFFTAEGDLLIPSYLFPLPPPSIRPRRKRGKVRGLNMIV
ncbi:MAG: nucleotidyl transferase AbiEii/AbiGii toxin family protein [Thermodesulfobacteriota bacterium]|nr:nucleotidyl transferase AbiEii/AbiGii toxin family protein [Thermodesulfobacteriota bacterium]